MNRGLTAKTERALWAAVLGSALVILAAWLAWFSSDHWWPGPRTAAAAPAGEGAAVPAGSVGIVLGNQRCAAAGCHGGTRVPGGEWACWITLDPHARAYEVLLSGASRKMAEAVSLGATGPPVEAHRSRLCLDCHTAGTTATTGPREHLRSEGVNCEACHGAASGWVDAHSRPGWKSLAPADRKALGFRELKDAAVRADTCVRCHVGSKSTVVDHDLLAGGHPRLAFELAAYVARLPKHWDAAAEKRRAPGLEATLWGVGQLATAAAAMEIAVPGGGAVREFAEFDCFACHHVLVDAAWRRRGGGPAPLGHPERHSWYLALAPWWPELLPESAALTSPAGESDDERAARWRDGARKVSAAPFDGAAVERMATQLAQLSRAGRPQHWDQAAQQYLAWSALLAACDDLQQAGVQIAEPGMDWESLRELARELAFPLGHQSPRAFVPRTLLPPPGGGERKGDDR